METLRNARRDAMRRRDTCWLLSRKPATELSTRLQDREGKFWHASMPPHRYMPL